jgi:hypothetical protein
MRIADKAVKPASVFWAEAKLLQMLEISLFRGVLFCREVL